MKAADLKIVGKDIVNVAKSVKSKVKQTYQYCQNTTFEQGVDQVILGTEKAAKKSAGKLCDAIEYVSDNGPDVVKSGYKKLKQGLKDWFKD